MLEIKQEEGKKRFAKFKIGEEVLEIEVHPVNAGIFFIAKDLKKQFGSFQNISTANMSTDLISELLEACEKFLRECVVDFELHRSFLLKYVSDPRYSESVVAEILNAMVSDPNSTVEPVKKNGTNEHGKSTTKSNSRKSSVSKRKR